jgi:hypothetical protein
MEVMHSGSTCTREARPQAMAAPQPDFLPRPLRLPPFAALSKHCFASGVHNFRWLRGCPRHKVVARGAELCLQLNGFGAKKDAVTPGKPPSQDVKK